MRKDGGTYVWRMALQFISKYSMQQRTNKVPEALLLATNLLSARCAYVFCSLAGV